MGRKDSKRAVSIDKSWFGNEVEILPGGLEVIADLARDAGLGVRVYSSNRAIVSRIVLYVEPGFREDRFRARCRKEVSRKLLKAPDEEVYPAWLKESAGTETLRAACRACADNDVRLAETLLRQGFEKDPELAEEVVGWLEQVYFGGRIAFEVE